MASKTSSKSVKSEPTRTTKETPIHEATPMVDQKPSLPLRCDVDASSVAPAYSVDVKPSFRIPKVKREPVESAPVAHFAPTFRYPDPADPQQVEQKYQPPEQQQYHQQRQQPVFPAPFRPRPPSGICKFWLAGGCPLSDADCPFDHSGVVTKRNEKCRYYAGRDHCKKAKSCEFMHETFPCRVFHLFEGREEELGDFRCKDPCKFSHQPLDDVTRPLFEEVGVTRISSSGTGNYRSFGLFLG